MVNEEKLIEKGRNIGQRGSERKNNRKRKWEKGREGTKERERGEIYVEMIDNDSRCVIIFFTVNRIHIL